MDLKVTNQKTNKTIFLEVKTGERGGNATEERAAKFLSSGIRRRIKRLVPNVADHPVLSVFQGSIFEGNKPFKINDKKGKATNIDPVTYREKVDVSLRDIRMQLFLANEILMQTWQEKFKTL